MNLIVHVVVAAEVLDVVTRFADVAGKVPREVHLASRTVQSGDHQLDERHLQSFEDVRLTDFLQRRRLRLPGHRFKRGVLFLEPKKAFLHQSSR